MKVLRPLLGLSFAFALGCSSAEDPTYYPPSSPVPPSPPSGTGGAADFHAGTLTEPVVTATPAPPPISGGTLALYAQGRAAAVSDPDRDQIVLVDLEQLNVLGVVPLRKGDEPGRILEDGGGRLHVALRSGGAVATVDPATQMVVQRDGVCRYPRGLAYDAKADAIHVACAGGELVSMPAAGGAPSRVLKLDRDLRDVVIDGERLLVSRFRAAELLVVEADGHISARLSPPWVQTDSATSPAAVFSPGVAWRTVPAAGGGALMLFQEEQISEVRTQPGGYGGRCGGIVRGAVSLLRTDGSGWTVESLPGVLAIDLAIGSNGSLVTVAAAGGVNSPSVPSARESIVTFLAPSAREGGVMHSLDRCKRTSQDGGVVIVPAAILPTSARAVAIAVDPSGRRIVQTREPSTLLVEGHTVVLPGETRKDTGHDLFHFGTVGGIACASCHPEGREDGHVWTFEGFGPRRTQSISGGVRGTEPFHWDGDMNDFQELANDVFSARMTGPLLRSDHVAALAQWIDLIPQLEAPAPSDAGAVERGKALFNDSVVGCATCHSGAKLTNNQSRAVGTGGVFQVPSLLGLGWRAPYMHHGRVATIADRFTAWGGGDEHGHVSSLAATEQADLVAYLESL